MRIHLLLPLLVVGSSAQLTCDNKNAHLNNTIAAVIADLNQTLADDKTFSDAFEKVLASFISDVDQKIAASSAKLEEILKQKSQEICSEASVKTPAINPVEAPKISKAEIRDREQTKRYLKMADAAAKWKGPADGCVQLINYKNETKGFAIQGYPKNVSMTKYLLPDDFNFHDKTVRVNVRPGCIVTLSSHDTGSVEHDDLLDSIEWGSYAVRAKAEGTVKDDGEGLSSLMCLCDPLETDGKPDETKHCERFHTWNVERKRCEWDHDDDVCAEVFTQNKEKVLLSIPNWPLHKNHTFADAVYVSNLVNAKKVLVRRGCFVKILPEEHALTYGEHSLSDNTGRFSCECMTYDSGAKLEADQPEEPDCVANHVYSKKTGQCEWVAAADACVQISTDDGDSKFIKIPDFPRQSSTKHVLTNDKRFLDKIYFATVRRGCMATFETQSPHNVLSNVEYGAYSLANRFQLAPKGVSAVYCNCDLTQILPQIPSPCIKGHAHNEEHDHCEFTGSEDICGTVTNDKQQEISIVMPNWPRLKSLDLRFTKAQKPHFGKIVSVNVRQHCFMTLFKEGAEEPFFPTKSYGTYAVNGETGRIKCECMF